MTPQYLVVGSETSEEERERRDRTGASSAETYAETLRSIAPDARCEILSCLEGASPPGAGWFRRFDAVFFAGSPIQMHEETDDTEAAARFMRRVFEAGIPSFGSCAGMQIAVVAAGGRVEPRTPRMEAAFVRKITATDEGRAHPLLADRPLSWDAPAMHSSEVTRLPKHATILAGTVDTPVQAIEVRHEGGTFWGVQYHPELTLAEIASTLRRQADELVEEGLARSEREIEDYAALVDALDSEPERRDLAWRLGIDREITEPERRMREIRNFMERLAPATHRPAEAA